ALPILESALAEGCRRALPGRAGPPSELLGRSVLVRGGTPSVSRSGFLPTSGIARVVRCASSGQSDGRLRAIAAGGRAGGRRIRDADSPGALGERRKRGVARRSVGGRGAPPSPHRRSIRLPVLRRHARAGRDRDLGRLVRKRGRTQASLRLDRLPARGGAMSRLEPVRALALADLMLWISDLLAPPRRDGEEPVVSRSSASDLD